MTAWRKGWLAMTVGMAIGGCVANAPPPPTAPMAAPVSYDGMYHGTVQLTGAGAGVPPAGCATNNTMALQVQNNAFVYSQPHPNAATTSSATTTYAVAITPNGAFSGHSNVGGTMNGSVAASHMSGTIDGIECVYSFTADRM